MNVIDYFLTALNEANTYRKVNWVISLFATTEYEKDWKKNNYPYKIVKTPEQVYYVDPTNPNALIPLGTLKGNGALLYSFTEVDINPNNVFNAEKPMTTTVGNVLANYILYKDAFGKKIPFKSGKISGSTIADYLKENMLDDPEDENKKDPNKIYVSDFLTYYKAYNYLLNFTQLWIPGDTVKSLQTHPDMDKLRKTLFETHKDELDDPAVIANIEAELEKLDREWLEGDSSLGLYNNNKDFKVIRKKLYYTYGNVSGFSEGKESDIIEKPLSQGWDLNKFKTYNNDSRAASFDRGASTALGGEFTKWILRASNNIQISEEDCKSIMGDRVTITNGNAKSFIGFYYLNRNGQATTYDESKINSYLGKKMIIRSPRYCKAKNKNYCKICMGDQLSEHVAGVSSALSKIGSDLMGFFMGAMHGKINAVAKYDINTQLK